MPTGPPTQQIIADCPACGAQADVSAHEPFTKVTCPACEVPFRARDRFDHFLLEEQCGVGGMSRVFRARDASLERDVALKILNRACSQDSVRVRQFEKEAEITAQVSHPNVVRVFTAGRDQGYFYIAMELVSGGSMEALLKDQRKLPEARVLEIAVQAVQGLAAAHKAGLIHRDIKPGNILFAEDGTSKIVDFGLAIFARDAEGGGEIWATPYYVPPETLHHEAEDFRSDIYSLGATLYHALLGRPPCEKDHAPLAELREIKAKQIHVKPATAKLSEETCAVLERALAVKREGRYASYGEFLDHLKYAQRRLRRGGKGKPWPGRRRHGFAPWQWAAAAALVTTGIILALTLKKDPPPKRTGGGGSLVTDADPASGSDSSTSARYLAAREAMLAGKFSEGQAIFAEVGANPATRQPTRNWASFNSGLCLLFIGNHDGARGSFDAIAQTGRYSSDAADAGLAGFFVNASRWLAAPGIVPPEKMADCATDDARAIGLLAAGLKNWNEGEAAAAAPFLKAFYDSAPPAWVESSKRLIEAHLHDATVVAALPAADVTKLSAEEADAALKTAGEFSRRLKLDGAVKQKAVAAVEALSVAVAKRKQQLMDSSEGNRTERANAELKQIIETTAAAAAVKEFHFAETAAKLKALAITTPEAAAVRDAHEASWQKAHQFLEQLAKDLAARPAEGVIEQSGVPVRAMISATGAMLNAKVAQGPPVLLPMTKAEPMLLVELATDLRARVTDSDDYYRRSELLHAFARRTGLTKTAAEAAEMLSAEVPGFRAMLSNLSTTEVTAAPGPGR